MKAAGRVGLVPQTRASVVPMAGETGKTGWISAGMMVLMAACSDPPSSPAEPGTADKAALDSVSKASVSSEPAHPAPSRPEDAASAPADHDPQPEPTEPKAEVVLSNPSDPRSTRLEVRADGTVLLSNIQDDPTAARIEERDGEIVIRNTSAPPDASPPSPPSRPAGTAGTAPASPGSSSAPEPAPAPPRLGSPSPSSGPETEERRSARARKLAAEVDAYLDATEGFFAMAEARPQSVAQSILSEGMRGNTSSLDALRTDLSQAAQDLRAIRAPTGCKECQRHKGDLLKLLRSSSRVLDDVRAALDGSAGREELGRISAAAGTLKERLSELESLESVIRAKYGR